MITRGCGTCNHDRTAPINAIVIKAPVSVWPYSRKPIHCDFYEPF